MVRRVYWLTISDVSVPTSLDLRNVGNYLSIDMAQNRRHKSSATSNLEQLSDYES
jgi:hypothetical protein